MSLLVHYTLKSADDHDHQVQAMQALVDGLKAEGHTNVIYSCFTTPEPTKFIGVLEFEDDAGKQAFLDSPAFATYRETVGPTFANPPQTTEIVGIASTFG
ncbi:MAG: hypothetical protein OXQ92_15300 [Boseongicola sp.]|nr:hypothetical protein [Boseongicola sp.]MDD9977619.1 hypothetical protein [Boseongicola sp.]